ncbi:MAG: hypothetical protein JWQ04_3197 [Pedosphaera sp.]|nr:hypothetical protein [Pedosphaera sp.]
MTNAFSLFRSLVVYGICLPLAIFIGYLLATPTDVVTFGSIGVLFCLLALPILLRWHYPLLIFFWNSVMGLYFLPGKPSIVLILIFVSFGFSFLAYVMNRDLKFISVPSVTRPLLFLTVVVLGTAYLTNSFGLNIFGSGGIGGKRYVFLLSGVVGFFALTAQRIPERKAKLYVCVFFLGALSAAVGSLAPVIGQAFYPLFLVFPPDITGPAPTVLEAGSAITRLSGLATTSTAMVALCLALFGIRGIFDPRKWWRPLIFSLFMVLILFGGFRSRVIDLGLTLGILFYLEGLMRSRMLPAIVLCGILFCTLLIPFADKLPLTIQRSLTFLPLKLDTEAELNAQASVDWRLEMWQDVLPQVPQYLILGKGYGIDANELDMLSRGMIRGSDTAAGAELAGDYHNGPLSVIMPFGILGAIGFIWFLAAGCRLLYRNYQFGEPQLENINRFLLVAFIVRVIVFFIIFGSLYSDLVYFSGLVGLSIALNGGMRSPVVEPVKQQVLNRFRLAGVTR